MNTKYIRWYAAITENAKGRILDSYTEKHHIIPRCLDGTDDSDNLVDLTAREHFVCHWLLTKIHHTGKQHYQMLNALRGMRRENKNQQRYKTKITARVYATAKEEWSKYQSIKYKGEGNPMYGREVSPEVRAGRSERASGNNNPAKRPGVGKKISDSKTGVKRAPFSEEWKANLSAAKQGKNNSRYGAEVTSETRKKIGDKIRGRKQTQEEKDQRGASLKALGLKREKKLCHHCQKEVAVNGYARWHGDNCKLKGK